jgi:hypothetical protein
MEGIIPTESTTGEARTLVLVFLCASLNASTEERRKSSGLSCNALRALKRSKITFFGSL